PLPVLPPVPPLRFSPLFPATPAPRRPPFACLLVPVQSLLPPSSAPRTACLPGTWFSSFSLLVLCGRMGAFFPFLDWETGICRIPQHLSFLRGASAARSPHQARTSAQPAQRTKAEVNLADGFRCEE